MSPIPVHPDITSDLRSPSHIPGVTAGLGRGDTRHQPHPAPGHTWSLGDTQEGLAGSGQVPHNPPKASCPPGDAAGRSWAFPGEPRPDAPLAAPDTAQLLRALLSIAELTTSPPAGWGRGQAHLEAIAAVTLQGDAAPQRGEPDPGPGSSSRPRHSTEPASASGRVLPGPEPLPAREHPGQAGLGNGDGAEPLGELETPQPCARAAAGRVGELPRDWALCFGELGFSSLEEMRLQGDLRAHFSPTEELWLPQLWECSRPGWTVKTWGSGRWGALGGL